MTFLHTPSGSLFVSITVILLVLFGALAARDLECAHQGRDGQVARCQPDIGGRCDHGVAIFATVAVS
jgi:hypothetical protein